MVDGACKFHQMSLIESLMESLEFILKTQVLLVHFFMLPKKLWTFFGRIPNIIKLRMKSGQTQLWFCSTLFSKCGPSERWAIGVVSEYQYLLGPNNQRKVIPCNKNSHKNYAQINPWLELNKPLWTREKTCKNPTWHFM